jgi:putative transferase (TIGR04331 family)
VLVAEWREQGCQLLYHQHGGGYGIDRQNVLEDYEVRVSDRYYTWGWRHSSPSVTPLSPAPLSAKVDHEAGHRRGVLLVCLETPRLPYRLWYQPMPGTMELVMRNTAEFVSKLNNPDGLLVRLAPKGFGWGMREVIQSKVPNTRFDDHSKDSLRRFAESSLVVHNYLGTGWLESLALDIPTVCFYSPTIQAFRAEAVSFIAQLEAVGILHRSGSEVAGFVKSLGKYVDQWWRSEEVQTARQAFVKNYSNFSSDWIAQWEAEFDSLPQV